MTSEAEIHFLADLRVPVAPIASADSVLIAEREPSGFDLPLLDSETTHMGQAQIQSNPVAERSEPESSGSIPLDILFLDSEPTRVGRRRRCRDMSGLSLCLCGESVQPGEIGSIQCQRAGCETIWVSKYVDFACPRLNLLSIIFGVLGMRIQDQDIGLVRCAHSQRRHVVGS
jgi:hypothetical protein